MAQPESDNSDSWRGIHGVAGSRLSSGIGTWPKLKSHPLLGGLFSDDQEAEPLVQSARANVDLEHVEFDHAQIRRSCILDEPMHQARSKAPALERRHDFDARDVQRGVAGLVGIDDTSDLAIDQGDDDPVRVERVVVEATLGAVIPGSLGLFNHVAQRCSMQRVEELVIGLDRSQHARNAPRGCQTLVEPWLNQSLTTRVRR